MLLFVFRSWFLTVLCLLLTCSGLCWFVYQSLFVPQHSFISPDWGNSQWIQAADAQTPVAYFRSVTTLQALPASASVTIAANQVFWLYVNGSLVGSNSADFATTGTLKSSMFDVLSLLQPGVNVLGIRAANDDQGPPALRVNFALLQGSSLVSHGSNIAWLATAQSNLVYASTSLSDAWARRDFNASPWQSAILSRFQGRPPLLTVPPALYEYPSALHWFRAGSGQETYLVGTLSLPDDFSSVWLRLAALGTAYVYLNGSPVLTWQGEPVISRQQLLNSMRTSGHEAPSRQGVAVGLYPVTPYLHAGQNILAIHVQSPASGIPRPALDTLHAALSLDLLLTDAHDRQFWITPDAHWHASTLYSADWLNAGLHTQAWPSPVSIAQPAVAHTFSLPAQATDPSLSRWLSAPFLWMAFLCCALSIALWLLLSWGLKSLQLTSLVAIPALACEGLLVVLSSEPLFPSFYTWYWGLFLLLLSACCYCFLWIAVRRNALYFHWHSQSLHSLHQEKPAPTSFSKLSLFCKLLSSRCNLSRLVSSLPWQQLRRHWPLLLLLLLALPLVSYDLSYEPYWQDELSSYYAAQGIRMHALPFFPSGFLYEKAELFSYLLALWQLLLGTAASREISVLAYLASLPLLYYVGCYFFERRCALLATAMLAFSPSALLWSRQVRMYELAQVLLLLALLLLFRALEQPHRARPIYLAMACLLATYLCHEEIFVSLPGFLLAACICSLSPKHIFPAICYQRHWWLAALLLACGIILQLWLTRVTHPPVLGTDSSQRPMVQFSFDNIPYYLRVLLFPTLAHQVLPDITLNTLLALGGTFLALRYSDLRARFCAVFWLSSLICLLLLFTMRADRYLYTLLPVYYLLGASMLLRLFSTLWQFFCTSLLPGARPEELRIRKRFGFLLGSWVANLISVVLLAILLLLPALPLSNYNLFVSRLLGVKHHRYPDYDAAGYYVRTHWHPGDVLLSVAPDFSVFYYSGHSDYFLSVDRALFLLERNGHIIDTSIGAYALFQQDDLLAVFANHNRVWIVSDNGIYQAQAAKRFPFPSDVHLVFEGYGSAVYLRSD